MRKSPLPHPRRRMSERPRPWHLAILVLATVLGWSTPAWADCDTVASRLVAEIVSQLQQGPQFQQGARQLSRIGAYLGGRALDRAHEEAESTAVAECVHEIYRRLTVELPEELRSPFASGYMGRTPPDLLPETMESAQQFDTVITRSSNYILGVVRPGVADTPPLDEESADIVGRWRSVRLYNPDTEEEVTAYRGHAFVFDADGTFALHVTDARALRGQRGTHSGTWSLEGDTLTMKRDEDDERGRLVIEEHDTAAGRLRMRFLTDPPGWIWILAKVR